ncbi:MAG: DNA polymerase III subunit gamma/tau [Actinobacteria bacterium]|nr:DNA polymerase III subunit gamma/tau [Actinomycetota bacterium]
MSPDRDLGRVERTPEIDRRQIGLSVLSIDSRRSLERPARSALARDDDGSNTAADLTTLFNTRFDKGRVPSPRRNPRICEDRLVAALYRKYRPQTFDDVVGQEAVVRTLTNAITTGKVRQAYLFAGPRGTGKTSLARILAKGINCEHGPTPSPDNTCHVCTSIANGTSLDVIEMDAASQRGIDDIRDIRDRVVLQPAEGRSKIYILDEAHQLTDAAWNALLKLIEEPPPHLIFVFCTTELQKVLATVRSRCQTFVFARPRLPDIVKLLRRVADGEQMDVSDAALALVARAARGSFRDAVSTLDQLASATGGTITVQDVLQLLGAVEDEVLFRLCDLIVDGDTAGALVFLEELSEGGQDLGRLVVDLLEHLRHLMLVQHTGSVPDTLPVTDEARERLREQANQLPAPTVVRMIDLLSVATDDMRQGGDPRLPLELALVKVTRPGSDLSRESLAFRLERLESGTGHVPAASQPPLAPPKPATPAAAVVAEPAPAPPTSEAAVATPAPTAELVAESAVVAATPPAATDGGVPPLDLERLQEAWKRSIIPAVEQRSIPTAAMLHEGHVATFDGETLTIEFPPAASFHRGMMEDPKNTGLLKDALYEVTGRRLTLVFAAGGEREQTKSEHDGPVSEDELMELMKSTFDARELD